MSRFSVENFCLTVPKFSFPKPFSVSLISGIEKVWIGGGRGGGGVVVSRFSVEKILSKVLKTFVEEPLCAVFQKISASEKVYG